MKMKIIQSFFIRKIYGILHELSSNTILLLKTSFGRVIKQIWAGCMKFYIELMSVRFVFTWL